MKNVAWRGGWILIFRVKSRDRVQLFIRLEWILNGDAWSKRFDISLEVIRFSYRSSYRGESYNLV